MTQRHLIFAGVVSIALCAPLGAQTTTTKEAGTPQVSTTQMTGEVVYIEGNLLVAKMRPSGAYRFFDVQPGREFIIDGQPKKIGDLKMGTVLTATVTTTTQPITIRTSTITNGTVFFVTGDQVIVQLENGENREYKVPPGYKFMVDGKPATVTELKKGMKVSGTKIVSEPKTEISTTTVVKGTAPKK